MKKSFSNILFLIITLCVLIAILKYPSIAIKSAAEGLYTWFNIVIPSLFPFFIVSEILINIGFVDFIGKLLGPLMKPLFNVPGVGAYSFSMSLVSGYPMGSKIVSDLRNNNVIEKIEADRMICFSSTSGPLFMLGTISIGMLNSPSLAPLIIYPHYLASITLAFILRFYKKENKNILRQNKNIRKNKAISKISYPKQTIGSTLANSVKNSINTILLIGGFMIFYSVLTELIFISNIFNSSMDLINSFFNINTEVFKGLIAGILELTTGCKKIATTNINLIYKIIIINFLIGWGGLSIHSQALNFISNTDINTKLYFYAKFFHGILASFYSIILYKIKYHSIIQPSFAPEFYMNEHIYLSNWPILFTFSIKLAILMIIYMLIASLIMILISSFSS